MDRQRGGCDLASPAEEEALAENFAASVTLNSSSDSSDGLALPHRPYAPDCSFYIRTGACKFGSSCRFNHPAKTVFDSYRDGSLENSSQIVCKYYASAGGCKYGESCRFMHSKEESETQFNILGLPIRMGEKECQFYMRNGTCAYGVNCVFNHPEPTTMREQYPSYEALNDELVGQSLSSLGNVDDGESLSISLSETPQLDLTSSPSEASHMLSDKTVHLPSHSSPLISPSERNDYLGPSYLSQRSGFPRSTKVSNASMKSIGSSELAKAMQSNEFPERPGMPECDFFMKTGDCKFKSRCLFHHPKGFARKLDCVLSDKGLPLRPGSVTCRYYDRFGICKFGSSCLFDHPMNHSSFTSPTWSNTNHFDDAGLWRKTDRY